MQDSVPWFIMSHISLSQAYTYLGEKIVSPLAGASSKEILLVRDCYRVPISNQDSVQMGENYVALFANSKVTTMYRKRHQQRS